MQPVNPIALNLAFPMYWEPVNPFVDHWKQNEGFAARGLTAAQSDPNGYPLEVPAPNGPTSFIAYGFKATKGGSFVLTYDGDGDLHVNVGGISGVMSSPNKIVFTAPKNVSTDDSVNVTITRSNKADHVRNIQIKPLGLETSTALFMQDFLDSLKGIGLLRFMDWCFTNDNVLVRWTDRPTPASAAQCVWKRGMCLEHMIDLCNQLGCGMAINIPHQADDTYITGAAQLIKSRLNPALPLIVEYTNEPWNWGMPQTKWLQTAGLNAGLASVGEYPNDPTWYGLKFYARRAGFINKTFHNMFGAQVTCVAGGQSANKEVNRVLVSSIKNVLVNPLAADKASWFDSLAIAPYFGNGVADSVAQNIANTTVDQILDKAEAAIPVAIQQIKDAYAQAQSLGLGLFGYEGGQHLVGGVVKVNGVDVDNRQNAALTAKLEDANRNVRMGTLYDKWYDGWFQNTAGSTLCVFAGPAARWTKDGSWGLAEWFGQVSVKWSVFLKRLATFTQATPVPVPAPVPVPVPTPPPAPAPTYADGYAAGYADAKAVALAVVGKI